MVQINIGLAAVSLDLEQIRDVLRSTQTILASHNSWVFVLRELQNIVKAPKSFNP